jgi:hypothetical protein
MTVTERRRLTRGHLRKDLRWEAVKKRQSRLVLTAVAGVAITLALATIGFVMRSPMVFAAYLFLFFAIGIFKLQSRAKELLTLRDGVLDTSGRSRSLDPAHVRLRVQRCRHGSAIVLDEFENGGKGYAIAAQDLLLDDDRYEGELSTSPDAVVSADAFREIFAAITEARAEMLESKGDPFRAGSINVDRPIDSKSPTNFTIPLNPVENDQRVFGTLAAKILGPVALAFVIALVVRAIFGWLWAPFALPMVAFVASSAWFATHKGEAKLAIDGDDVHVFEKNGSLIARTHRERLTITRIYVSISRRSLHSSGLLLQLGDKRIVIVGPATYRWDDEPDFHDQEGVMVYATSASGWEALVRRVSDPSLLAYGLVAGLVERRTDDDSDLRHVERPRLRVAEIEERPITRQDEGDAREISSDAEDEPARRNRI